MPNLLDKVMDKAISRREFIKKSAVATAAITMGVSVGTENSLKAVNAASQPSSAEGKWVSADCWHNCGGRCLNKVYVVDGVPIRQKTDDTKPDTPNNPQQRSCVRGRNQRFHVLGADRLKYPMKRKHWEPFGGGDKSLRGRDEWERISWDEAIAYIVDELNHARRTYGNSSIVGAGGPGGAFLGSAEFGGFTTISDTGSFGSFAFIADNIGLVPRGDSGSNDRLDLRRTETIIMVGNNPAWSSLGNPSYNIYQAKEAGAKFVYVGPTYNFSADTFGARWIPTRPATDVTLMLAVAYTMITEDDPVNNPIIDWDFLHSCTVGFDAEHMPADARVNENFKDYVLGRYDGVPKTPEWATEICGTPVEDIRWLARELRKDKRVAFMWGLAPARGNDSEDFPQIMMTIGAMGGHMGKPGHSTGAAVHMFSGNNGFRLTSPGGAGVPAGHAFGWPPPNPVGEVIMAPEVWNAIIDGKYRRTDSYRTHGAGSIEEREIDIRVIYHGSVSNALNNFVGASRGIEAHRKVDFVFAQALSPNAIASYADIVLPLTSEWERPGNVRGGNRDAIIYSQQVIERMYECKSDYEIGELIAHGLNLSTSAQLYPRNEGLQLLNRIAGCTFVDEQLVTRPLVTLTETDLRGWEEKWGPVHINPQQGLISLQEFADAGVFQVERSEGDNYYHIHYRTFREDPEANPLATTPSGKLEIYSQTKADMVNAMGRSTIRPYPSYRRVLNGYEDSFADWENKIKGPYPYQVTNPHYPRRAHSNFDNVPVMREAFSNPFYINPADAAEKGIQEGDTVLIYNQHGKTLRPACLTERLMPGYVELSHGPWLNVDHDTEIDSAGAVNYVTAPVASGVGVSGYNTQLVNFQKYDGEPLAADHLKPVRVVGI